MRLDAIARQYWPTVALFALLLALWQLAVTVLEIRPYLLPPPAMVWDSLWHADFSWWPHIWITSLEIVGAFLMAAVVGVALGTAIAWVVTRLNLITARVTLSSILMSFFFSMAIGLFFGIYPAFRAANLHPMEALRSE